ncbi:MAG: SDR family NAD(P)-dependent oxidoreductase [Polyangiaceae bacterium]|nr:SDR family NAD(P)-dependent oxidoreductase [Myxococcales bacterium]MCB9587598.1 SDR family NAD(P)-dependent oxidoreductase [Polyangiaceae bacterium]MCB9605605.1 SDR family NAD(P)-dependent oxidoreductase [Polyangiaceae bacterium]
MSLRKVLITGGTRGIGRALAEVLVHEGAEVLVCGRSRDAVEATQRELGVRGVACDITLERDRERLASVVRGELAGLDVLIHNAGVQHDHDVCNGLDLERATQELALNLSAPIALTDRLLPLLVASGDGCLVNVTSALGVVPSPRAPVYSASKAALSAWSQAIRPRLATQGVRVVEVIPPVVATEMTLGRQDGAISAEQAASAIVRGLRAQRDRIVIGKAKLLLAMNRVAPSLARRVIQGR